MERRRFVGGLIGLGSTLAAGCLGDDSGSTDDADGTDDAEAGPEIVVNDRALSSGYPMELVEPDATDIENQAEPDEVVAHLHTHEDSAHWHFDPVAVTEGEQRTVRLRFVDENYEALPLGPDEPFRATVELVEESPDGFLDFTLDGDLLELDGRAVGSGELGFELWYDDEPVWEPPPLATEVVES